MNFNGLINCDNHGCQIFLNANQPPDHPMTVQKAVEIRDQLPHFLAVKVKFEKPHGQGVLDVGASAG